MPLLDLEAFRQAPLAREPFMYTVVPRLVAADDASRVLKDFPAIDDPGLLPVEATAYGPRFGELIAELQSEAVARAFS